VNGVIPDPDGGVIDVRTRRANVDIVVAGEYIRSGDKSNSDIAVPGRVIVQRPHPIAVLPLPVEVCNTCDPTAVFWSPFVLLSNAK
jgi:hypothetical protein